MSSTLLDPAVIQVQGAGVGGRSNKTLPTPCHTSSQALPESISRYLAVLHLPFAALSRTKPPTHTYTPIYTR